MEHWLDDGLRRGEHGRLASEYPLSMGASGTRRHHVIYQQGRPAAHAMLHPVEIQTQGRRLRVGLVGNVYTDPAYRGRHFASACVDACVADARRLRLPLVLLWSDAWDFYARLGFHPVSRERFLALEAERIVAAEPPRISPIEVGAPVERDWLALESLYAAKPQRVLRKAGALRQLAAAPDCVLRVARVAGSPAGYAAVGRGDDFPGVIHEWAGGPGAVLACLADLVRGSGAHTLLCGPSDEPAVERLIQAGAKPRDGAFALARVLDAPAIWRTWVPNGSGVQLIHEKQHWRLQSLGQSVVLDAPETLDLLFGAGVRGRVRAKLPRLLRRRLDPLLPWPLYLWGFDSI
ncbi:MAG: GNAT family N-acetyltransferase [Myxococcota bacterium]